MPTIRKSEIVPYSADSMYALVNDIEAYPEFLPLCSDARIQDRDKETLTASVSLAAGKLTQTFTTRNHMVPGHRIEVTLLNGPFRHLTGFWKFHDLHGNGCRIELEMDFEFKSKLLKFTLSPIFTQFVNSLVTSFTSRAREIYGRP